MQGMMLLRVPALTVVRIFMVCSLVLRCRG